MSITTLADATSVSCKALQTGKRLKINYNGYDRIVEVHAVGHTKAHHDIMRVWQVSGGSRSGVSVGWKLFRLDAASNLVLTAEASSAPRFEYRRGDKAMADIFCQL